MKHPIALALGTGLLVLLAAAALPLWQMVRGAAAPPAEGLPWQVRVQPDGSAEVFGLRLGRDRLADAEARFGDAMQVALVARAGEVGALEALVDPMHAGFVSGRLVLAFDAPPEDLRRWRERATGSAAMDGGLRRFTLLAADRDEARQAPIVGLSFLPSLRLDEADVRKRFGVPAETRALPAGAVMLIYPDRGLAATVGPGARGVLQYVAPRDVGARLLAPLAAASKPLPGN